jgi:type IV secretory pathway VirJ component
VFQSSTQRACRPAVTKRFVSEAPGTAIQPVSLDPKSGDWEAALSVAVQRLDPPAKKRAAPPPAELAGLPIVEVPAKRAGSTLAILISGDGGWAGIDKAVAASLAEKGIAVVGVDSLRYFWKERTPQSAAADVDRIVQHYLSAWDKKDILLIGYSQGADILPFVVNRLPAATRADVRLVAMLGLGERAVFEFHLANWLSQSDDGLPIAPELQRMSKVRALCIYNDEGDSSCPEAASSTLRAVSLPGGHHFGGDYDRVAALILEQLR